MHDLSRLINESDTLQTEAEQVINDFNLIHLLSNYGTPEIIGSMALKVMTRKDIDIEVVAKNFRKEDISEIIKHLSEKSFPRIDFTVMDNTQKLSSNLPVGFYIGIKYAGKDKLVEKYKNNPDVWQIDLWFLTPENAQGSKATNEIKAKLTPEKRETILKIKFELTKHEEYKGKFSGIDIYRAVLSSNISTTEEFLKKLSTN